MIELNAKRDRCVLAVTAVLALTMAGCERSPSQAKVAPSAIHLVDLFETEMIQGSVAVPQAGPPRYLWRFDGASTVSPPDEFSETLGWQAGPDVADLAVKDGLLVGRSRGDFPLIRVQRSDGLDEADILDRVEVRLRVSAGSNLWLALKSTDTVDLQALAEEMAPPLQALATPILADGQFHTYTLRSTFDRDFSGVKHIVIRPTDAADAIFEIESVRLIGQKEHLAGIASGRKWYGLSGIYRESIVARAPEVIEFTATLPDQPWLDLAIGTTHEGQVTFQVTVTLAAASNPSTPATSIFKQTVTTPDRWEPLAIDLAEFAGRSVKIALGLESDLNNPVGLWGAPVIRSNHNASLARPDAPQGVILIWADTLRRDHLDVYGYHRPTAPVLKRMAAEGALFSDCIVQATWTKVSTPSLLAGLYPTTHGVVDINDKLPASATTLAEVFREAGYATLSMSSFSFTGQRTNLHQGFEELHESTSLPDGQSSKTSREYVDRLLPWIERHRQVPFFVFLHVTDPHDPYEPKPPYNTMWADPKLKSVHEKQTEDVKKVMTDHLLKLFGMPTRAELVEANIDPDAYIDHVRDWYDGSIRGMDAEIGRLMERLDQLGLDRRTLVVFTSDHGEEFFEHGRMFHGQSVYGELSHVPLIVRQPGTIPAGRVINHTVQSIDLMPTLLELCGLPIPDGVQGRSVMPLLVADPDQSTWTPRGAFIEKASIAQDSLGPPPRDLESYSIIVDNWKLVHNVQRPDASPEFELYEHQKDPLDRTNLTDDHPAVVKRLAQQLADWRRAVQAVKLASDEQLEENLSAEELERLRALGYIQ